MGSGRTLWEKLAFGDAEPAEHFEDGLLVPLDAVLPTPAAEALTVPFVGPGVLPTRDRSAVETYLESGFAQPAARVASDDPHVLGLGARGVVASHRTPAVLHAAWTAKRDRVGIPRRTRVQVNGPFAPGTGPVDAALMLLRQAGPGGFANAILEVVGDVTGWDLGARRDLCASLAPTGCLSALTPVDDRVLHAYGRTPPRRRARLPGGNRYQPDADAAYDELVVVNADELEPLAWAPRGGHVVPVRSAGGPPLQRVVVGGCVGGDADALEALAGRLDGVRTRDRLEFWVVPASPLVRERLEAAAVLDRFRAAGAEVRRAQDAFTGPEVAAMATCSCLAPAAFISGGATCLASARAGRLATPLGVGA